MIHWLSFAVSFLRTSTKSLMVLGVLLVSELALAQQTPSFTVDSFYQASAYLTERFIPFAVNRQSGIPVDNVVSVTVGKPCYSMIDPHRSHIFHIYCSEAAEPSFKVVVLDNNQQFSIELPQITVKKMAIISSTPANDAVKNPQGPSSDSLAQGRTLFVNNCARCHPGQYPLPGNVTANSIQSAINRYSAMSQFRNRFTASELSHLAKYISEGL